MARAEGAAAVVAAVRSGGAVPACRDKGRLRGAVPGFDCVLHRGHRDSDPDLPPRSDCPARNEQAKY